MKKTLFIFSLVLFGIPLHALHTSSIENDTYYNDEIKNLYREIRAKERKKAIQLAEKEKAAAQRVMDRWDFLRTIDSIENKNNYTP